jgi:heme/copper-type cytochrome/quinol oxidase subunit 1
MHSLVRRYIKTAIAFLFAGLLIGGWMMTEREMNGALAGPYLVSAHTHAILVGFVMMMILGVALWLFPRPDKSDTRYRPVLAELAYWLVAVGTAVRILGELLHPAIDGAWLSILVLSSGWAQIAGIGVFFYTMWTRIRGLGSAARELKGERF